MGRDRYYYSTRDLLMMAAMAALGGIASTYINFIGDFFQSVLGFAGATQWAAGFHILWLVLAVGLTRKQGAGTITGILKGGVEFFSGNTHGLLVVLVDIVAGVLVDLGLLPFKKRDHWLAYAVAGGLASASNVFVFQLFAAVPADVFAYGVIGLIALVAFISGVVFAGLLGTVLINTLRQSGVVKDQEARPLDQRVRWAFFISAVLLAGGVFGYLKIARSGPGAVAVNGAVSSPYQFSAADATIAEITREVKTGGVTVSYRGFPLQDILQKADPEPGYKWVLLRASDGYTFFVTSEDVKGNSSLLLQAQGQGEDVVYNMLGPPSKKAWVNGVVEITLVDPPRLELVTPGEPPRAIEVDAWVSEMDSTNLDVGYGTNKYQGVPLRLLIQSAIEDREVSKVILTGRDREQVTLPVEEVREDQGIRLFVILEDGSVSFAVAHMRGEVYATGVRRIKLR